jgi:cellulose synthase/poly-beta-1,6-N-acetylglucosamine synthase-like glycosyltransferase
MYKIRNTFSGSIVITLNGNDIVLHPGQCVDLEEYTTHDAIACNKVVADYLYKKMICIVDSSPRTPRKTKVNHCFRCNTPIVNGTLCIACSTKAKKDSIQRAHTPKPNIHTPVHKAHKPQVPPPPKQHMIKPITRNGQPKRNIKTNPKKFDHKKIVQYTPVQLEELIGNLQISGKTFIDDLTVILTVKDRTNNIPWCLESIAANTHIPRVILVDFGSTIPVNCSKWSFVKVIRVTKNTDMFHKSRALNIGIRACVTKYCVTSDIDEVFAPNFFDEVSKRLRSAPNLYLKCHTYQIKRNQIVDVTFKPEEIESNYSKLLNIAKQQSTLYGDGCLHATNTEWLLKHKGFCEDFVGWGPEDSDLTWRAQHTNMKLVGINQWTSMVHMPHEVDVEPHGYHAKDTQSRNFEKLNARRANKIMQGNNSNTWGEL